MSEPVAVWSGTFELAGVTLRCHVLDDGRRIIEEASLADLFAAMENGALIHMEEAMAFARWERGQP